MIDRQGNTEVLRNRSALFGAALVLALAVPAAHGAERSAAKPAERSPSPERVHDALARRPLRLLEGGTLGFDALSGDVLVVHFWATWCRPCQRELQALDQLDRELNARGGRVLAIAIDSDAGNVRRFAREHGLTLPIVADGPAGVAQRLQLAALPYTLVLDRAGQVALATEGTGDDALDRVSRTARRLVTDSPRIATTSQTGGLVEPARGETR